MVMFYQHRVLQKGDKRENHYIPFSVIHITNGFWLTIHLSTAFFIFKGFWKRYNIHCSIKIKCTANYATKLVTYHEITSS